MYVRRFILGLAVIAIVLIQCGIPASASISATAQPADACAYADSLLTAGLLTDAQTEYETLLKTTASAACAKAGLGRVRHQREVAVKWEAAGDVAAAKGQLAAARTDYLKALNKDQGNAAALTGLQNVDGAPSSSLHEASDYWSQIVSTTLVPVGQFFLWFLGVCAGVYILYLLIRFGARWLPLPPTPSRGTGIGRAAVTLFVLAVLAGTLAGRDVGRLVFLVVAVALVVVGCVLCAWCLRSGSSVQFKVVDASGDDDKVSSAFLAGRLNALGKEQPRGFDLPENTDVTSLTGVLTALPGGGILSALAGFFLARVPMAPWTSAVTLIDKDQLVVTLHRNGRLKQTVLANRGCLLFPVQTPGQDTATASPHVQDIDQSGLLTMAAAIILVAMAVVSEDPPELSGLNGATSWQSVAGQVLATDQGFSGNEDLSKALLARAVDADPGNLAAQVAQAAMEGRRAEKPGDRKKFAERMEEIGCSLRKEDGYTALKLRVYYSAAAGWYNVYLDRDASEEAKEAAEAPEALAKANKWLAKLIPLLEPPALKLAESMRPMASMLRDALSVAGVPDSDLPPDVPKDSAEQADRPSNSAETYAMACLDTAKAMKKKQAAKALEGQEKADELEKAQAALEKALDKLKTAVAANTDLRIWARYDPSFRQLLTEADTRKPFLDIVGDQPAAAFTDIGPLTAHAAQLSEIGVHSAADLIRMTTSDADKQLVGQAVGVSQLVVARWRGIAQLSDIAEGPEPGELDLLIANNVDSPHALQMADLTELDEKITAATKYSPVKITLADLQTWAHPDGGADPDVTPGAGASRRRSAR